MKFFINSWHRIKCFLLHCLTNLSWSRPIWLILNAFIISAFPQLHGLQLMKTSNACHQYNTNFLQPHASCYLLLALLNHLMNLSMQTDDHCVMHHDIPCNQFPLLCSSRSKFKLTIGTFSLVFFIYIFIHHEWYIKKPEQIVQCKINYNLTKRTRRTDSISNV